MARDARIQELVRLAGRLGPVQPPSAGGPPLPDAAPGASLGGAAAEGSTGRAKRMANGSATAYSAFASATAAAAAASSVPVPPGGGGGGRAAAGARISRGSLAAAIPEGEAEGEEPPPAAKGVAHVRMSAGPQRRGAKGPGLGGSAPATAAPGTPLAAISAGHRLSTVLSGLEPGAPGSGPATATGAAGEGSGRGSGRHPSGMRRAGSGPTAGRPVAQRTAHGEAAAKASARAETARELLEAAAVLLEEAAGGAAKAGGAVRVFSGNDEVCVLELMAVARRTKVRRAGQARAGRASRDVPSAMRATCARMHAGLRGRRAALTDARPALRRRARPRQSGGLEMVPSLHCRRGAKLSALEAELAEGLGPDPPDSADPEEHGEEGGSPRPGSGPSAGSGSEEPGAEEPRAGGVKH